MTKNEVIEELVKDNVVEKIIYKLLPSSKNRFDAPDDLIQDIYLILLQKDDKLIVDLYNKNQLGFYLLKIARNQMISQNSNYYYNYVKFRSQSDELEAAKNIISEDSRRI